MCCPIFYAASRALLVFNVLFSNELYFNLQEAVQYKGLRDDTTCIVIDILPPEKLVSPMPAPKKHGMGMGGVGVFKNMFRRRSSESSSYLDKDYPEPDVVEEIFEEGSAMLAKRCVNRRQLINQIFRHFRS